MSIRDCVPMQGNEPAQKTPVCPIGGPHGAVIGPRRALLGRSWLGRLLRVLGRVMHAQASLGARFGTGHEWSRKEPNRPPSAQTVPSQRRKRVEYGYFRAKWPLREPLRAHCHYGAPPSRGDQACLQSTHVRPIGLEIVPISP